MNALLIARREITGYTRSPLGAVIVAASLLANGLYFYVKGLSTKQISSDVLFYFFNGASGVVTVAAIILAVRLIAEERQSGTMVILNTSPVSPSSIILGKFVSAFAMVAFLTALSVYMPALIFVNGKVSIGHIAVGYAGMLLMGSAVVAIGLFASTLTRSQVVAGVIAAAICFLMYGLGELAKSTDPPVNGFLSALALYHKNITPFMKGILNFGGIVYYSFVTYFFLLAATRVLDSRRWR
jgi:ABC-2 type transport system permease protein